MGATNCLFYALALYWRRKAKGKRVYLSLRKSDLGWTPHFLVFELRNGQYRVISYKPTDSRIKNCPPPIFDGKPHWGDQRMNPIQSTTKEHHMSDSNYKPDGTGVVMGDTKPMPDRGTSIGMPDVPADTEGMSLDQSATNSMGSITGSTQSDPAAECYADDPTFGPAKGDMAEDKSESY